MTADPAEKAPSTPHPLRVRAAGLRNLAEAHTREAEALERIADREDGRDLLLKITGERGRVVRAALQREDAALRAAALTTPTDEETTRER